MSACLAHCDPQRLAGVVETGHADIDTTSASPHLGRVVTLGETAYVANSFDGVAAFRVSSSGVVTLAKDQHLGPDVPRCTTIALHAPSSTLYCAAADRGRVELRKSDSAVVTYSLGGPDVFRVRDPAALRTTRLVASMQVLGDQLYYATFDGGLQRSPIAADGSLGPMAAVPDSGDAIAVAGDGSLLAQLDRDAGLRVWRVGAQVTAAAAPAALDGPPLAAWVDGNVVGVALGSTGVAVYELAAGRLERRATLRPPCAAVAVALRGGLAVAACMNGLYLYDWPSDPSRVRGYVPAAASMLDVGFVGDRVVASDWFRLAAHRVDVGGESLCPLLPRGLYVRAGDPVTVPVVNPGAAPLHLRFTLGGQDLDAIAPLTLGPGERVEVVVPAAAIASALRPGYPVASFDAHSDEALAESLDAGETLCDARPFRGGVTIQVRQPDDPAPPVGAEFPRIDAQRPGEAALPQAGRSQWIIFNNESCVALWPELQDLAWRLRRPNPPLIALVTSDDPGFVDRWRLGAFTRLVRGDSYGLYSSRYTVSLVRGTWHTEYFVDAEGVVRGAERVYTGYESPVGGVAALRAP